MIGMGSKSGLRLNLQNHQVIQQNAYSRFTGYTRPEFWVKIWLWRHAPKEMKYSVAPAPPKCVFMNEISSDNNGIFYVSIPPLEGGEFEYTLIAHTQPLAGIWPKLEDLPDYSDATTLYVTDLRIGEVWLILSDMYNSSSVFKNQDDLFELKKESEHLRICINVETNPNKPIKTEWRPLNQIKMSEYKIHIETLVCQLGPVLYQKLKCPIGIIQLSITQTELPLYAMVPGYLLDERFTSYIDKDGWILKNSEWVSRFKDWTRKKIPPSYVFNEHLRQYEGLGLSGIIWNQGVTDLVSYQSFRQLFRIFIRFLDSFFNPVNPNGLGLILTHLKCIPKTLKVCYESDPYALSYFNLVLSHLQENLKPRVVRVIPTYDLTLDFDKRDASENANNPAFDYRYLNRLAMIILGAYYGLNYPKNMPSVNTIKKSGGAIVLGFDNDTDNLAILKSESLIHGFAIANPNGEFRPAYAKIIDPRHVRVYHPEVSQPTGCSYAFEAYPIEANLGTAYGYAAIPFTTHPPKGDLHPQTWLACEKETMWSYILPPEQGPKSEPQYLPLYRGASYAQVSLIKQPSVFGDKVISVKYNRDFELDEENNPIEGGDLFYHLFTLAGPYIFPPEPLFEGYRAFTFSVKNVDKRVKYLRVGKQNRIFKVEAKREWQHFCCVLLNDLDISEDWLFYFQDSDFDDHEIEGTLYFDTFELWKNREAAIQFVKNRTDWTL